MNTFLKSMIAMSVSAAVLLPTSHAAKYQVIETTSPQQHKFTFGKQQNNQGDFLLSASNSFNLPIQFQYLSEADFNNIKLYAEQRYASNVLLDDIQDFEALKAGTPTANDLAWATSFIQATYQNNSLYQKFYDIGVMVNRADNLVAVPIFDQVLVDGQLTRSTVDFANGITNDGWIYGNASAPFLPLDFTKSDESTVTHWVREFATRGYVTMDEGGTIHSVVPIEARFGGQSAILDMNDNMQGVGYVSTAVNASALEKIEDESGGCADPEVLKNTPFDVCVWNLSTDLFHLGSVLWQFDATGAVVASTLLGDLITSKHADDKRVYKSYAQAVNNAGVAVGFAHGWIKNEVTEPRVAENRNLYAVIYKNGQVIDVTEDHSKEFDSRMYDINDQGIAVGHVNKLVNGSPRSKFFYLDTNQDTPTKIFPSDFFTGSASVARAINEHGLVVGEGEVESHNDQQSSSGASNPRRRHGFLYNINDESFVDLNRFLACNTPYTIVEARGINDNNEISATALVKVPRRDAKGELVLDGDGNQLTEDVTRGVILKPIVGEVEDCSTPEDKVSRKGASFAWLLLPLMLLTMQRRARNIKS